MAARRVFSARQSPGYIGLNEPTAADCGGGGVLTSGQPNKKKKPTKTQLVAWFAASKLGDVHAVSSLLEAHRPHLLHVANTGLDAQLKQKVPASDVVQLSLIKATFAYSRSNFTTVQDVAAWLHRILSREIALVHRRFHLTKKRDANREMSIHSHGLRKSIDLLFSPESCDGATGLSRQEEIGRLIRSVELLPSHYRQVIKWRVMDELSFQSIGEKLNRSPDAVRMLFERAITKLRTDSRQM